jgi:hypothetical protein
MMSTAIQWSGPLLVLGALLFGLTTVAAAMRPTVQSMLSPDVATLAVLAASLLVTSLPGMYAAQADAAGAIGLAGYALFQVGLLLLVVVSAAPLLYPTVTGPLANHPLTGGLGVALFLGLLLTSIATLQAGVYPRPAALLLIAGTAGFFFGFFVSEFLPPGPAQAANAALGVLAPAGLAWCGAALWMRE